ncbi:ABC transporter ATP-binding protein [Candidatus Uabimicrobium sp. HlEnr_7]|uniref:ABC transporter ATP-binding protein n=1 Tax=Candidatus Uabimicrobium helgolandensis TaxID=3095367 RepID=UPI0035568853
MASVTLQNIHKKFGKTVVIEEINLTINDGEFVTFLGPSGCGKSTTLNMIAGLETCTSGKILFNSEDVTRASPSERDIAMVFQSYALYPHLNVFDNIAFPLAARKIEKEQIKQQVEKAAKRLELSQLLHRFPRELSGGQRQRVALGRAIVRTPKVFLFDEPLSNLDVALKVHMRSEIKTLHQDLQSTMIYVTHDQEEAMSLSDRIAIFNGGKLQQFASPDEVYQKPANLFVATFIGSPPMNLWQGEINGGSINVEGTNFMLPQQTLENYTQKTMTIGIRPHQFEIITKAKENSLKAKVVTNQLMGECRYLDVEIANKRCMVKATADFTAKRGESIHLDYTNTNVHCFDENGNRNEYK